MPELIALFLFLFFIWFTFKSAKFSFRQLKKFKNISSDIEDEQNGLLHSNTKDFHFIAETSVLENEVISNEEEIPLDNRNGSSPIASEHEFSRTVSNILRLDKTKITGGRVKTNLWTLIETEVKKNLTETTGADIGEQVTRRVSVKLEAAPGKVVKYKIIWKQKQRTGNALISLKNREIQIPDTTTYGLFHSVTSVDAEIT
jgi:hypothetical protein